MTQHDVVVERGRATSVGALWLAETENGAILKNIELAYYLKLFYLFFTERNLKLFFETLSTYEKLFRKIREQLNTSGL